MKTRFRNQLLLLFVALIAATLLSSMLAVWQAANLGIRRQAEQGLSVAQRVFQNQMSENARDLGERANLLANDFGFKRAIATNERETVISVLANHGERVGADLMFLLSPQGEILESTHPFVHPETLTTLLDAQTAANGRLVTADGDAFQVVLAPVRAPDLIAWVGLGFMVDEQLATMLKQIALTDVSFIVEEQGQQLRLVTTLPSTLIPGFGPQSRADQLAAQIRQHLDAAQMLVTDVVLLETPSQRVRVLLSISLAEMLASYAPLRQQMLLIASVAMLLAALSALLIARGVSRPITALMQAAERIAGGEYHEAVAVRANNEFAVLAGRLNEMQRSIDEREIEIRKTANHDILTNLPNRRYLGVLIGADRAARPDDHAFGLAVIGIGKLQELADAYGMDWCDELVQQIARRLDGSLRRGDRIAQLSREQFLMYCDGLDREGIEQIVDKLLHTLEQPFECRDIEVKIDMRMGFVLYPEHGRDYVDLLRRATIAFHNSGASAQHYGLYVVGQDQRHLRQIRVTHRLQQAITRGGLSLNYQPKLDLQSDRVTQAEALLRWHDEELGPVYPDEFIPLAEQSGDIVQLSEWVVREAIAQRRRWQDAGIEVMIAVNLSARDFLREDFVAMLEQITRDSGVAPQGLVLEITESATIVDTERAIEYMAALRALGFGLAMDDFGTGYSSLSQLKLLPLDELKIDKSFVLRLDQDLDDQKIVKSTIELGHNLGLRVVAEGVENAVALAVLRGFGCDAIQGYHLGKPMPAAQFEPWWREHEAAAR